MSKGQKDIDDTPASTVITSEEKEKKKGLISRIWNGIFRLHGDDFEQRLKHISKEEAAVLARMKKRSLAWRKMARNLIVFSLVFEVIAVGYAIMTTRSLELDWKMRALRVLPMFFLPGLSYITYTSVGSFNRMCDRKDKKTLERLRAERQAKIDELKAKTNYYTTQQLIQRYDPDPAAKAAAASILASKLGAESGLTFHMEDSLKDPTGASNDVELKQSTGMRRRKQQQEHLGDPRSSGSELLDDVMRHYPGSDAADAAKHNELVVENRIHSAAAANDGGWLARIAALLVGEDPTQSYALICGNCHMHNGLARKEDFPYITYYCPHCNALNRAQQLGERGLSPTSPPNLRSPKNEVNLHNDDGAAAVIGSPSDEISPTFGEKGQEEEKESETNVSKS